MKLKNKLLSSVSAFAFAAVLATGSMLDVWSTLRMPFVQLENLRHALPATGVVQMFTPDDSYPFSPEHVALQSTATSSAPPPPVGDHTITPPPGHISINGYAPFISVT